MTLTTKTVHVHQSRVSYYDEGLGETPVVFIHGFPFSKAMWSKQLTELSGEHRVIAYDVRGHGGSEAGTSESSIAAFAEDFIGFIDSLQIKKVIVCGLSMGGYIALHVIEKYPERISALILADTQCAADTDEAREKRKKAIASIKENGLPNYAEESVKNLFALSSFTTREEEVSFIKKTIRDTTVESVCNTLRALAERKEKCSTLENIHVPVLIIVGSEDKITPLTAAHAMHERLPQSQVIVIEEAGHLSNLENPDAFNQAINNFLKTVS